MINLLPPQKLANIRIARSNTTLRRYLELLLAVLAVTIVAIIAAYYFLSSQKADQQGIVSAEQARVAELEPVQKEAEQLSATINTIAGISSRDVTFSNLLVQIGGLMPEGTVLTGLQFSIADLDSPLVVSAQIESEAKAAVLLQNLQASDLFEKADIKTIIKNEEEETVVTPTPSDSSTETATTVEPPKPASPYRFTTVIEAYFTEGIIGAGS